MRTRAPNGQGTFIKRAENQYEWRQNIDGHRRTVSATSMKELRGKVELVRDRPFLKNKASVNEWFGKWLSNYVEPLTRPATYDQYKIMFEKHISPNIGKRKIATIEPHDIQGVIAVANKAGKSTWTMKHIRKVMHLGFQKAMELHLLAKNPVVSIAIPKKTPKEQKVLTPEEIEMVINALGESRWLPSFYFLLSTGVRRGELLALTWSDIEEGTKRIRIDQSLGRDGTPGDTKSANVHYVPLSSVTKKALEAQKVMLMKEGNPALSRDKKAKDAYVFPNKYGNTLLPGSYYTMMAKLFKNKKDKVHIYPHALRHTFVYLSRGDITDIKDLQGILGHSSSTTTLDIYGDIINDKTERTVSAIDKVMSRMTSDVDAARLKRVERDEGKNIVKLRKKKAQ